MTSIVRRYRERCRAPAASGRDRSRDAGDTLVELLVAITIIGIAAAGLLGGLAAAIGGSGSHRSLTSLDTVVRSFAETTSNSLTAQDGYVQCASSYSDITSGPFPSSGPANTAVTVFGSGFGGTGTPSTPTISGGSAVINPTGQVTNGQLTSTFNVPALPAGPETITVGFGPNNAPAAAKFVVTPLVQLDHASGPTGTLVHVSTTGFGASNSNVTVKFGATAATATTVLTNGSTNASGSGTYNFNVPSASPGLDSVWVADSAGNQSSTSFTVTTASLVGGPSANAPVTVSPLQQFQVGITGVQYWDGSKFTSNQAACQTDPARSDDVQELTVAGTAPGANDQLNFIVANPTHLAPPPAAKVVFTQEPVGAADGALLSPQPTVSVEDATGDLSITNSSITLGIASQPVGGNAMLTCSGTGPNGLTMTAPNGVANFSGCYIVGKTGFYTLSATAAGLTGDTSTTFQVSVGPAYQLVYTNQPGGGQSGVVWGQQPQVTVEDIGGNTVPSAASVSLVQNGGTGLSCTGGLAQTAVNGVASFAGCKVSGAAGSYTLTASATSLSVTSNSFTITPGTATELVFTTQPGGAAAGANLSPQPVVSVEDNWNNVVTTSTASIALTPIAGLSCTGGLSMAAVNGVATFAGCQIAGTAGSYTLTASSGSLSPVTSSSFTITPGAATKLVFTTQPGGAAAGANLSPQPAVSVEDNWNNVVTTSTASIGLAQTSGTGLTCTGGLTKAAVNGVATFAGCKISGTAGSYTLTASASGLTTATSNPFNISAGTATKLAFTPPPTGGVHNTAWAQQPIVIVEDTWGNTVITSTASVTLSLTKGSGLSCTGGLTKAAVSGIATFSGCKITNAGSYTLKAASNSLTAATTPVTIT